MNLRLTLFITTMITAVLLEYANLPVRAGVTVITHGWEHVLFGGYPVWVDEMARAVMNAASTKGLSSSWYHLRVTGNTISGLNATITQRSVSSAAETPEVVMTVDWSDVADHTAIGSAGITTAEIAGWIAGGLRTAYTSSGLAEPLAARSIHLIGHSRGGSVVLETARILGSYGIWVDHVTTLDPHPLTKGDTGVIKPDPIAHLYDNVIFADNYWRIDVIPSPLDFNGQAVPGAENVQLDESILSGVGYLSEHSDVHAWYHGTIGFGSTFPPRDGVVSITEAWYASPNPRRDLSGFFFTRLISGDLHYRPAFSYAIGSRFGGRHVRESTSRAGGAQWANVGFVRTPSYPNHSLTQGDNLAVTYKYQDRDSSALIEWFLDSDANPFNGTGVALSQQTLGSTGDQVADGNASISTVGVGSGVKHLLAKITSLNDDSVRYDYCDTPLVIVSPTLAIADVWPRILKPMPLGQRQWIKINGNGFNSSCTLLFNDGSTPIPSSLAYLDFKSATEIHYNIAVGPEPADWTVKVINGAAESNPYMFYVVPGEAKLTGLSISGPAAVNQNSSGLYTATAIFSDGSNRAVGATWSLNAGAPANIAASGQLTAGSVGANTPVTVSASYMSGGVTKTATYNVTVVKTGGGGGAHTVELVTNGSFRNGSMGWSLDGRFAVADSEFNVCHTCPGYAYLANYDGLPGNNLSGTLRQSQAVQIPPNATTVTLSYWYRITTAQTTGATDWLGVQLLQSGGGIDGIDMLSNLDANTAYAQRTIDISGYRGKVVTLQFGAMTDGNWPTTFRIDDVSIQAVVPDTPTPLFLAMRGPSSVQEGATAQYDVIVVYSDGSLQPVTPMWSVTGPATISASGLLSARTVSADALTTVTATYNAGGTPLRFDYPVTVLNVAPAFSFLSINGPDSMNENSSAQFTATAIFSDGSSQAVSPSWSEDSTATTISSSGLLTAGEVSGDTVVKVSANHTIDGATRSASQQLTIVNLPPPPALIALLISGPSSVTENSTSQYTATAFFSDGSSQPANPAWSEDSQAATISQQGLLSAGDVVGDTRVNITANYTAGGTTQSAQRSVTIVAGPQLGIEPTDGLTASGNQGGPFNPSSQTYTVSNTGGGTLNWTVSVDQNWVSLSLVSGQDTGNVTVSINADANRLIGSVAGTTYTGTVTFGGNGGTIIRSVILKVYTGSVSVPQFSSPSVSDSAFRVVLSGSVGDAYIVEASFDLVTWLPVLTNTIPASGQILFTNAVVPGQVQQFYRAVQTTIPPSGPTLVVDGLNLPTDLVLAGEDIYFADSMPGNGIIKRVAKSGGSVATLATGLSTSDGYTPHLTVVGDTLYGGVGGYNAYNVFSMPAAGGPASTLTSMTGGRFLGVSGGVVYFSSGFSLINSIPVSGGSPIQIAANNWVRTEAMDDSAVYFVEYFSRDVRKCVLSSGVVSTLISGNAAEGGVFIDTSNVYFNIQGNIEVVGKDGGPVATLVGTGTAYGFASDGTGVFFVDGNIIKSVPVAGGPPTDLTSVPTDTPAGPGSLVVDDSFVYWADRSEGSGAGKIWRMSKSGH